MKKLLLPVIFGAYLNVNSQVYNAGTMFSVYYNINPDTLLNYTVAPYTNETYGLDLFDDAGKDIEFTARGAVSSGGSAAYILATSLNPHVFILFGRWDSVYVPATSNWYVTKIAKPLNAGDPINATNSIWDSTTLYLTDHSGHGGGNKNVNDWIGGDKYLGIKYQNGSIIDYGWIRVQCVKEDSCYLKDFSHSPLGLAVSELNNEENISVYPNPSFGIFTADLSRCGDAKICIYDVLGNCLLKKDCLNDVSCKIDLSCQPKGVYFMEIMSDGARAVKKIVVE